MMAAADNTDRTPVWELSKENTAPLQRGRNVAVLERSLAETDETRAVKERAVDRYERTVRATEQEGFNLSEEASSGSTIEADPLVHWLGYIKFHQESFPANTHDQFLLMERCFRALSRFRRYANDVRFIRLCCQYAEKTERPNEIFQYLYRQKIGHETAIFWIAWGFVAEKREEWAFANDVYSKGIRKRAKPLEKLNKRYREFQRRMARQWLNATQAQDDDNDDGSSPNRGVLGALTEDAFHRNDRSTAQPPGPSFLVGQNPRATGLQSRSNNTFVDTSVPSRSTNGTNQNSTAPFPIFVENEPPSENPLDDSLVQAEVPYRQIEREQDRKKENTYGAERWNDRGGYARTYKKTAPAAKPRMANPPPFAVFVDEECAQQHQKEESRQAREFETHRRVRDERTFRERDDLCVGDALFKDPLRYVRDPSQLEIDQKAHNESSKNHQSESKRKANAGFSTRLLRHPDTGEEQNFEEARAIARYYKLVSPSTNVYNLVTPNQSDNMSMEEDGREDDDVSMSQNETSETTHTKPPRGSQRRKSISIPQNVSLDQATPRNASTASSTVEDAASANLGRADPTINTQLALKELSMMFSSPAVGLNDSASTSVDRSGGLGPILNESGVSEPAEDRSMVVIAEEQALGEERFEGNEAPTRGNKRAAFSIYNESESSDDQPSSVKQKTFGFEIFDETEDDVNGEKLKQSSANFGLYDESEQGEQQGKEPAFSIYQDGEDDCCDKIKSAFPIYTDASGSIPGDRAKTSGFAIHKDNNSENNEDTGTLSSLGDVMNGLNVEDTMTDNLDKHVSKCTYVMLE